MGLFCKDCITKFFVFISERRILVAALGSKFNKRTNDIIMTKTMLRDLIINDDLN
ncbi:hypothetical protein LguiA_029870 [Lonicera macranthoides]